MQVNQKSLPQRTADAIAYMLHTENYRVGAKLPNEILLSERFEVSRSTIRQAIAILREKGIVRTERGSGTFVAEYKMGDPDQDPLGLSLIYDKRKMAKDLLELRLLIEPRCAMLAAQNATRQDVELLFRICDEFESMIKRGENYTKKDMEFHQAIANCSGNTVIHNLIPYIHQMQKLTDHISRKKRMNDTAIEHRRIAQAIAEGRASDAYDYMQYHLAVINERFMKS